ncbi:hypothetical protein ACT02A_29660 [Klebsiella quasipneumoniae]|uniref:hypothetical protein n=1 Tax=Klebsiella quasipneumoniae TaxID=1463165 RepID=UPI00402B4115
MTTIFQSSTPANNPKLQYAVPDNLLKGYGTEAGTTDGVFLFRLDDKRSFPLQAAPASPADAAILNLANNISAQASLGGDVAAFTWNAARKSLALNSRSAPRYLQSASNFMARFDAATHPAKNQYFALGMYVRIPSADDFVAVSTNYSGICGTAESLTPANEFGGIAFTNINGTKAINAIRGTDGGALRTVAVPATNFLGKVCLVVIYRDAAGMHLYVEATDGTKASAMTAIANVPVLTTTMTSRSLKFGVTGFYSGSLVYKHEFFGGWLIDLETIAVSDIPAFASADLARQIARGWMTS